jgi:hypothetical protein
VSIWRELSGQDCIPVAHAGKPNQQIQSAVMGGGITMQL